MNGNLIVRMISTGVVGAGAAVSSYNHMFDVASRAGENDLVSTILPLTVDGMLLVATGCMIDDQRTGRAPRPAAKLAFVIGIGASVAANVAAAHPTPLGRAVAAWPAIALLLVVWMLEKRGKVTGVIPTEVAPDAPQVPDTAPVRKGRPVAETLAMYDRLMVSNPTLSRRDAAGRLGISDDRLREVLKARVSV